MPTKKPRIMVTLDRETVKFMDSVIEAMNKADPDGPKVTRSRFLELCVMLAYDRFTEEQKPENQ